MGKNNLEILEKIKKSKTIYNMAKIKQSINADKIDDLFRKYDSIKRQEKINKIDDLFKAYDDKQKQKKRKHKKQDTTHYANYKQVAKATKKNEKKQREVVKVKLATLADKLYRDNKITKSLYNKMYNLSIGASRLPALDTAYRSLKDFKDSDTTVKKSHFIQAVKEKKEAKKAFNTIYIKYKQYEEIDGKKDTKILNHTFTMTGDENDVRKEIKQFLSYALSLPYVLKVKIIRLVINKEDKDSDFYRWKGGKKSGDGIKYMKAWKAQFQYHGFKVDLNDETPYQCVPNALYKMYGNREAGRSKFIAGVADKGIEYVKSVLEEYHHLYAAELYGLLLIMAGIDSI